MISQQYYLEMSFIEIFLYEALLDFLKTYKDQKKDEIMGKKQ